MCMRTKRELLRSMRRLIELIRTTNPILWYVFARRLCNNGLVCERRHVAIRLMGTLQSNKRGKEANSFACSHAWIWEKDPTTHHFKISTMSYSASLKIGARWEPCAYSALALFSPISWLRHKKATFSTQPRFCDEAEYCTAWSLWIIKTIKPNRCRVAREFTLNSILSAPTENG